MAAASMTHKGRFHMNLKNMRNFLYCTHQTKRKKENPTSVQHPLVTEIQSADKQCKDLLLRELLVGAKDLDAILCLVGGGCTSSRGCTLFSYSKEGAA
jgi:hypothetical protein